MKDWYCKPSSFEEAVEIVERAVANGAVKHEWPRLEDSEISREYRWRLCDSWGCLNKNTFTGNSYYTFSATEHLTIQQVRERFPLPSDEKEWPYRGCKATVVAGDFETTELGAKFIGKTVTVISLFESYDGIYLAAVETDDGERSCFVLPMIKPVSSKRDKWIEAASVAHHSTGAAIDTAAIAAIYDAGLAKDIE